MAEPTRAETYQMGVACAQLGIRDVDELAAMARFYYIAGPWVGELQAPISRLREVSYRLGEMVRSEHPDLH